VIRIILLNKRKFKRTTVGVLGSDTVRAAASAATLVVNLMTHLLGSARQMVLISGIGTALVASASAWHDRERGTEARPNETAMVFRWFSERREVTRKSSEQALPVTFLLGLRGLSA
jgi:hypothetical protein